MGKRYLSAVSIAVALLAIGTAGAIADRDENNPPGAGQLQVTTIEAEAKQAMELLRGQRSADDALRDDLASRMGRRPSFGLNPELSRLAIKNTTHSVYVIPARDHVCATLTDPEGAVLTCPSTGDVVKGNAGPATVGVEPGGVAIFGIVPDGVDSISVQTGESESIDVPTEANAYYVVTPQGTPLRSVSYVGPSGPVKFPIADPALAMKEAQEQP